MAQTDWPAWYYGPGGEAEIFQRKEDVPRGWQDNPNNFEKRKPAKEGKEPKADDKKPAPPVEDEDEDMTRDEIIKELERLKVTFDAKASDAALYRKYEKAIKAETEA